MFVAVLGVVIECDVFSFVIKQEGSGGGQALRQGGLAVKLMRQLTRFEHSLRVDAGGGRKSAIEFESRHTGLAARLIGQRQKLLLGLEFFVVEGNVGRNRRYGP